ncbi:MAG: hypothetical protein Q8O55_08825 [Dehalococcoidales bacterium]|nr:hypothetical protein [Dehalococcoidales bacterium]
MTQVTVNLSEEDYTVLANTARKAKWPIENFCEYIIKAAIQGMVFAAVSEVEGRGPNAQEIEVFLKKLDTFADTFRRSDDAQT